MAIPTTFLKLLKAAKGEKYSVDLTNGNLDLIDAFAAKGLEIKRATSAYKTEVFNAMNYGSSFLRISSQGEGIVIAKIAIQIIKVSAPDTNIPSPAYSYLGQDTRPGKTENEKWVVPVGFGSKDGMYPIPSTIAGNGVNHEVQMGVSVRDVGFRRSASGTPTVFTANTNMYLNIIYQWDGIE